MGLNKTNNFSFLVHAFLQILGGKARMPQDGIRPEPLRNLLKKGALRTYPALKAATINPADNLRDE